MIKAWADGSIVQYFDVDLQIWVDANTPIWEDSTKYSIKPAEPERVYPVTRMSLIEIRDLRWKLQSRDTEPEEDGRDLINAALRHAIDNGQVVTKEEFEAKRNARDKAIALVAAAAVYIYTFGAEKRAFNDLGIDYAEIISKVP